ncbi:MAG: HD domain-containing protein [Nitrospirae bacterium]|nr:HD domain-containing protein [Nitrospirota bacterium]
MPDKVSSLITSIMVAVSNCRLYSKGHESVSNMSEKIIEAVNELSLPDDTVSIMILGNELIFNNVRLSQKSIHTNSLMRMLRRKGTDKVIFKKGVTSDELMAFISELALPDSALTGSPHISIGAVAVRLSNEDIMASETIDEGISKIREIYHGLAKLKEVGVASLEDMAMNFISAIKSETDILSLIKSAKFGSESIYAHTINVSILSIFQAESLGLSKDIVHEVGIAGLLHDVGKMFIPEDIFGKRDKLNETEWAEVKKHPVRGALYLSTLPDVPELAIIAAFEHHMKFNGSGYPETKKRSRQHLVSQIVAISDFFDALRTEKPYRKALGVPVILGLLTEGSVKDFNPLLVENFISSFKGLKDA